MQIEATQPVVKKNSLKLWSKISMIILLVNIIAQLASAFQTEWQLTTPLIPRSTIWEINRQIIFSALVFAIAALAAAILYFFEKHLVVIILTGCVLVASRYIYI